MSLGIKPRTFINCIKDKDKEKHKIDIPDFKAFVSDAAKSHTNQAGYKSGGITLNQALK